MGTKRILSQINVLYCLSLNGVQNFELFGV